MEVERSKWSRMLLSSQKQPPTLNPDNILLQKFWSRNVHTKLYQCKEFSPSSLTSTSWFCDEHQGLHHRLSQTMLAKLMIVGHLKNKGLLRSQSVAQINSEPEGAESHWQKYPANLVLYYIAQSTSFKYLWAYNVCVRHSTCTALREIQNIHESSPGHWNWGFVSSPTEWQEQQPVGVQRTEANWWVGNRCCCFIGKWLSPYTC